MLKLWQIRSARRVTRRLSGRVRRNDSSCDDQNLKLAVIARTTIKALNAKTQN
jgi:hypothetical protein